MQKKAGSAIIRTYRDYHPLKVFTYISFIFFVPAIILFISVLDYYLKTGVFTGRVGSALMAGILFVTGIIIFIVGLLADMIKRNRELQEEILYRLKKNSN